MLSDLQCGLKSENPEMSDGEVHDSSSSSTEEIKQITSEIIKNDKEADESQSDVEKLMLLTSKRRSSRGLQDEEVVVDLTEPRLESFCLPNV